MPGIAGIISQSRNETFSRRVKAMVDVMASEDFYRSMTRCIPEMGIYAGFVGIKDSTDGIFSDEEEGVSIFFSGECFVDSQIAAGQKLILLYKDEGPKFVEKLNGLFCGLVVDKKQRKAFLFNDRYGIRRVYYHEDDGNLYFASEAKALLRILPKLRQFDPEGIADFLAFGCTLDWKTMFHGIEILPGGSLWSFENGNCRTGKYFFRESWESQRPLMPEEFEDRFQQTFKRILPRYFESPTKIGVALTGGLDTRMIMACRPQNNGHTTCYTFSGNNGETLDDKIAARVAATSHLEHNLLRLSDDFFSHFAAHADKTVFATDGCAGVLNTHEIYFNHRARKLAPIRLTGNYGSEILRGISTFKRVPLEPQLLNPSWRAKVNLRAQDLGTCNTHPMTFAAFKEIPWNLFGNLEAGRSQLHFRTPYLDNELVALAYRAPEQIRKSSLPSFRLVRVNNPALSEIPTDRGFAGDNSGLKFWWHRILAETTFKLDYYNTAGLPNWLAPLNPTFKNITSRLGILGLHKFLRYPVWFQNGLASYVNDSLAGLKTRLNEFWNPHFVNRMAAEHIEGRKNYCLEINAVLTLDAIERLFFRELPVQV